MVARDNNHAKLIMCKSLRQTYEILNKVGLEGHVISYICPRVPGRTLDQPEKMRNQSGSIITSFNQSGPV